MLLSTRQKLHGAEQILMRALFGHEQAHDLDYASIVDAAQALGIRLSDESRLDETEQMIRWAS